MHLSCERNLLKNAIDQVSKAISTKQTLPILGNVLLEAKDNQLKLTASSLDIGITSTIPVEEIREVGSTTCSAKMLADITNNLPNGLVNLDIDSGISSEITVSNSFSTFKIATLSSEEFPQSILPKDDNSIVMDSNDFCDLVNKAIIAAADPTESRPIMQGISVVFDKENIVMVSTDGKRLSKVVYEHANNNETPNQIVIPAKPLTDLLKILDKDNEIKISYTKTHFFAVCGNMSFFCKLIEGTYPDYERVIPKECNSICRIGRESLIAAIKRVIIMAKERDIINGIKFNFENDTVTLTSETSSVGSAEEKIAVVYQGEPLLIGFNGTYIMDALRVLDSDEIIIELRDGKSGITIRNKENDNSFLYICMPLRLFR